MPILATYWPSRSDSQFFWSILHFAMKWLIYRFCKTAYSENYFAFRFEFLENKIIMLPPFSISMYSYHIFRCITLIENIYNTDFWCSGANVFCANKENLVQLVMLWLTPFLWYYVTAPPEKMHKTTLIIYKIRKYNLQLNTISVWGWLSQSIKYLW